MGLISKIKKNFTKKMEERHKEKEWRNDLKEEIKNDPSFREEIKDEYKKQLIEEEKAKLSKKSGILGALADAGKQLNTDEKLNRMLGNTGSTLNTDPSRLLNGRNEPDIEVLVPRKRKIIEADYIDDRNEVDKLVNDDKISMMLGKKVRR